MSPSPSIVDCTSFANTRLEPKGMNPDLLRTLRRCTAVVYKAETRSDPALEPLISRGYAIRQGLSGQLEHAGTGTIASIDRLAEDIERVLEGGHVEVKKVDVKGVDLDKKEWDYKTNVEKKEKKKRRKGCVTR